MIKVLSIIFLFFINCYTLSAQNQKQDDPQVIDDDIITNNIKVDSLSGKLERSPLKASLYSAILPGLGQFYNKKYIKAPIVLGVIATGAFFVKYYDDRYKRYHNAYLAELSGLPHEFSGIQGISPRILANAEDTERRNRDYAIAITALAYLLNIVDAAVDAHLSIFDKDKDLALTPVIMEDYNSLVYNQKLGLSLNFRF